MRSLITEAIRQCVMDWPRIATTLLRVDPRPKEGIGTIAADKNLRLYYDPEWIKEQTFDDIVFWIKQEILPPLLQHPKRCQAVLGKTDGSLRKYVQDKLNIASDLCVYGFMENESQKISDAAVTPWKAESCKTGAYLTPGLSLEEYFHHLYDEDEARQLAEEPDVSGDDDGGDSGGGGQQQADPNGSGQQPSGDHKGGSGTDGEQRDWDDEYSEPKLGDDSQNDGPCSGGVGDEELNDLTDDFAGSRSRGSGGREGRLLQTRYRKPKVSPEQLLRMAVKSGCEDRKHGHEEPTYRRPSRRRNGGEFIRPSYQKREPKITIVIDTSASMGQRDIALGCGMVKTALNDMKLSSVRVISADTQINTDMVVSDITNIELRGRGGTCMDVVCDKVAEDRKDQSSLIICVTDGETPWPSSRRVPIVAAITRESSPYYTDRMPSYIRKVELYTS